MSAVAAVGGAGAVAVLVAFLIALVIAVAIYYVGIYLLHAPQPAVGLVAFVIFIIFLLVLLPGNVLK